MQHSTQNALRMELALQQLSYNLKQKNPGYATAANQKLHVLTVSVVLIAISSGLSQGSS